MIVRMIATGSLSAFSSAALPGLPSQASRGIAGPGAVRPARVTGPQPQSAPPVQLQTDQGKSAAPTSGQVPPRGSLLDLSV